ncbi:MAG TPA: helix-turn-helix transcriptional regulator [Rubrobacter sp.]|nr:helix-turn-helix transcriptional regulator [Rubrobacter sp.]
MQLYLVDGARLRELREQAGLSQEELSLTIGQSGTWAEEMEREGRVHVLEIIVQKLTMIFGVEISDLSTFPDPPVPTVLEEPVLDVEKLRHLREEAALSQEQLDELAELEPGSIARAESVDPTSEEIHASVDTIWRLAMALKVSPTILTRMRGDLHQIDPRRPGDS